MKKAQLPLIAELDLGDDTLESTGKAGCKFIGGSSKKQLRVLHAITHNPLSRKQVDHIAIASNGPDVIMKLRRRGLELPCHMVPCVDRDGCVTRYGVYMATAADTRKIHELFSRQKV